MRCPCEQRYHSTIGTELDRFDSDSWAACVVVYDEILFSNDAVPLLAN